MNFLELCKGWFLESGDDVIDYLGFFSIALIGVLLVNYLMKEARHHYLINKLIEELENNYSFLEKNKPSSFIVVKDHIFKQIKYINKKIPDPLMRKINFIYKKLIVAQDIHRRCHGVHLWVDLTQERLHIERLLDEVKMEIVCVIKELQELLIKHDTFAEWRLRSP